MDTVSEYSSRPARPSGRIVFLQYFGFFTIGLALSLMGPLIPVMMAAFGLDYGTAGIIFPAQSVGSIAVLVFSSALMHKLEKRRLLAAGCVSFLGGLGLCALAPDFAFIAVGNAFLGAGVATFEIGLNTLCIDSHPQGKGKALNRLHFFFGAGAVAGPLVALLVEKLGPALAAVGIESWRWALWFVAAAPLVVLIVLIFTSLPPSPPAEPRQRFAVYRRPLLWLAAAALCLYCGLEWGVGGWFPSYWQEQPLAAALHPAFVTSLFWLTFSLGRFVSTFWADRLGFRRFLTISLAAAIVVVAGWLFIPGEGFALAVVLALGFIISGIYPTIVALAAQPFPASSAQVAGFLSVFGVVGGAVFPAAVGFWANRSGIGALTAAEFILTLALLVVTMLAFAADKRQKRVE